MFSEVALVPRQSHFASIFAVLEHVYKEQEAIDIILAQNGTATDTFTCWKRGFDRACKSSKFCEGYI